MAPWHNLSPIKFEEFCYHLLKLNKFKNLSWYGKGGNDKGRDIIATKTESPLAGMALAKRWVVQCKHYPKADITKSRISDWLAGCKEHKPDRVLLIISRTLTANMKDWLDSVRPDYRFEIHVWEETDLETQYHNHGVKLRSFFPELPKLPRPILMQAVDRDEYFFACTEFEEVGIHVYNAGNRREAMKWVKEFVEFIKANEFQFDGLK